MNIQKLRAQAARFWQKEVRPMLILAAILFSIRSSLADWNPVPTGSMKPTIVEGDGIFVNKLAYDLKVPFTTWHIAQWSNPQRGDIVVFFSPHDGKRLVKRVIGLPGDTIELRNNVLVLNGRPVEYKSISEKLLQDVSLGDLASNDYVSEELPDVPHAIAANPNLPSKRDFGPVTVPADHYFMMGDNRDNSFDSRYYGPVPRSQIVGRATCVVISVDLANYWVPRWHRFFHSLKG